MEENLEYKQQYLRSEIIDQGYNPDDFSEFMSNKRENEELNLELWSFKDLKNVVEEYKLKIGQILEQQNNLQLENNNIKKEIEENNDNKNQIIDKTITFPKDAFEEYEHIIKTVKLKENEISNNNDINIKISNPIKINPGFFSSSYYQYTVQTNPLGYKVVRKLSDFSFIQEIIPLFNASVFNPPLPNFEFGLKDFSPKKMLLLENYMNSLMENKFFRTLPIIYEFLTLSQEDWNKKRIEKYNKMKVLSLEEIPTLEGEFHILINKINDEKGMKIKDEIEEKNSNFDELNIALDEILELLDKISLSFKKLSKAFLDLNKVYKNNNTLFDFFKRLSSLSKVISRNYLKEKDFFENEFKYFFNNLNKENNSFSKKCEELRIVKDDYINKFEKMKKNKNKSEKDLNSFYNLRKDYGLELLMVLNEYENLVKRQGNRALKQFLKYSDNKQTILQNFNNCLKLLDINEDPNNINIKEEDKKDDIFKSAIF